MTRAFDVCPYVEYIRISYICMYCRVHVRSTLYVRIHMYSDFVMYVCMYSVHAVQTCMHHLTERNRADV